MVNLFMTTGLVLCLLLFLVLYRTITGPTIIDRILGANVIGTKTTILLVILGILYGRVEMFVDIALAYAMLNFIVTIAVSRYFMHHRNISPSGYGLTHKSGKE